MSDEARSATKWCPSQYKGRLAPIFPPVVVEMVANGEVSVWTGRSERSWQACRSEGLCGALPTGTKVCNAPSASTPQPQSVWIERWSFEYTGTMRAAKDHDIEVSIWRKLRAQVCQSE